jgi:hypothetical protein
VVARYVIVNFAGLQEGEKHFVVKNHKTSFTSSSSKARKDKDSLDNENQLFKEKVW